MENLTKDRTYWQNTWNRFKEGDREAFGEIYNEYTDMLYDYGMKLSGNQELVKDCIQDLFVDLFRYGKKLGTPEYLEFYLIKSLKRSIIHKIQKSNRVNNISESAVSTFDLTFDLENQIIQNESEKKQFKLLQDILKTLDPKKRELLFLRFNSGLNYFEIGKLVGLNPDTVKKQVYRLLDSLKEKYGAKFAELFVFCLKL